MKQFATTIVLGVIVLVLRPGTDVQQPVEPKVAKVYNAGDYENPFRTRDNSVMLVQKSDSFSWKDKVVPVVHTPVSPEPKDEPADEPEDVEPPKSFKQPDKYADSDDDTRRTWSKKELESIAMSQALKVANAVESTRAGLRALSSMKSGGSTGGSVSQSYRTTHQSSTPYRAGGESTGNVYPLAHPYRTTQTVRYQGLQMSDGTVLQVPLGPGESIATPVPSFNAYESSKIEPVPWTQPAAQTGIQRGPVMRAFYGRYYTGADGCRYDSRTGRKVSCPASR